MTFSAKANDCDYTIHDAQGVTVVKDGVKHIISKEDWDRENPHIEHRNSGCNECNFVQDKETLFTFIVPREAKQRATEEPKDCGVFTMTGWVGHSNFYLFRCAECDSVMVDYPHGYHGQYWYLRCSDCGSSLDLSSSKFRSIYEDNNGFVPKFREEVGGWLKRQFSRLSARV